MVSFPIATCPSSKPPSVTSSPVFGAGFLLGPVRIFLLAPKVGVRAAELIEMPILLAAIYFAARQTNEKFPLLPNSRLCAGLIALTLMLSAELAVATSFRGLTIHDALLNRDPVSGTAYYASLMFFALLPRILSIHLKVS